MAVVTPTAKAQFIDAAGVPLAGGFVYTYAAGTTTPQTTYTDSTATTANSNPIVLDSRGEANIWLGSATYKFKLCDSNNTEIWTVDNISAPTSALSPVLSGNVTISSTSSGPALTITQAGTGAIIKVPDPTNPAVTLYTVDNTGHVGIGTASPANALDVAGGTIQISSSGGTSYATLAADASNTTLTSVGTRGLILNANSTNLVYGTSSGYVGIKNASPTVELDVTGAIKTSGAATIGGNTAVTGTLSATGNISTSTGNITATAGSITAGTSITATTSASVGTTLSVDTIAEKTSNAGVTIDGVLCKDSQVDPSNRVITSGTAVATTSGTSVNFTGIPSWVRRVTVVFAGVSLSGTDSFIVQIGPSGGVTTSGYVGSGGQIGSGSYGVSNYTAGFGIPGTTAAEAINCNMVITKISSSANTYVASYAGGFTDTYTVHGGGSITLSGVMTQLTIKSSGTGTFDAGSVNIFYE